MRDSMPYICVKSINGCFYYSISEICLNPFFEINTIGMRTKLKPNIFFKNLLKKNVLPYFEKKNKRHSILHVVNRMYENPELEYVCLCRLRILFLNKVYISILLQQKQMTDKSNSQYQMLRPTVK